MESKIDYHVLSMDEIVFDNRNKIYGAFAVRQAYEKNLIKAILISIGIFGFSMSTPVILKSLGLIAEQHIAILEETVHTIVDLPASLDIPKVVETPKPSSPAIVKSDIIVPVSKEEIKTEIKPIIKDPEISTNGKGNPNDKGPLNNNGSIISGSSGEKNEGKTTTPIIYKRVEQMPEFIGGEDAFYNFVEENLIYPEDDRKDGIEGTTKIQFIIDENGFVKDASIVLSSGYKTLDEEALRLVKSLPKYKPGKQNGNAVRVLCVLPIGFGIE